MKSQNEPEAQRPARGESVPVFGTPGAGVASSQLAFIPNLMNAAAPR